MTKEQKEKLAKEFAKVVNKNSLEGESNTPDYIAGEFLATCFEAYNEAARLRDNWFVGKRSISEKETGTKW